MPCAKGATVVTGNKYLAAVTLHAFEQSAVDQGLQAWPTPRIWPWPVWLQAVWEEARVSGSEPASQFLLGPHQEQRVWEDIITESMTGQPLLQVAGVVRDAQQAWQLVQSWNIALSREQFHYNHDSASFFQWASKFENRCRGAGLAIERMPC